jgi:hypothetical protein
LIVQTVDGLIVVYYNGTNEDYGGKKVLFHVSLDIGENVSSTFTTPVFSNLVDYWGEWRL